MVMANGKLEEKFEALAKWKKTATTKHVKRLSGKRRRA